MRFNRRSSGSTGNRGQARQLSVVVAHWLPACSRLPAMETVTVHVITRAVLRRHASLSTSDDEPDDPPFPVLRLQPYTVCKYSMWSSP